MLLLALLACRTAELVDLCGGEDTGLCPPCASDDDCVVTGNPCLDTAYCVHRDAPFGVIEIGCSRAMEHRWPPDDRCRCVDGACVAE